MTRRRSNKGAPTMRQPRRARSHMGRDLAMFGIGAAIMLVASRLAPPLAGQAIGTVRGMAGGDPFDALARDHRLLLSLLRMIEETPNSAHVRRTAMLFQAKRMLTAHALAEEDIVYPLLHDRAEREEATMRLYREHAEMKMLISELERLDKGHPSWLERLRELRSLVEEHARDEERSEFPRLRTALGQDRLARLMGQVQREKALVL